MFLARWVLGRDVEGGKVVEIFLDMRPLGERETHLAEDRDDLVDRLADRVDAPGSGKRHWEGDVGTLLGELFLERGATEPCRRFGECCGDLLLCGIQRRAGMSPLLGIEIA